MCTFYITIYKANNKLQLSFIAKSSLCWTKINKEDGSFRFKDFMLLTVFVPFSKTDIVIINQFRIVQEYRRGVGLGLRGL